jgi:hypothetical protein
LAPLLNYPKMMPALDLAPLVELSSGISIGPAAIVDG